MNLVLFSSISKDKSKLTGVLRHLQLIEETCLSIISSSGSGMRRAQLTKTDEVCKHATYDPEWGDLPNRIENTTQDIENHPPNILLFVYIYLMWDLWQCFTSKLPAIRSATRLIGSQKKYQPFIGICPDVDNPDQNKQNSPAGECTLSHRDALHFEDIIEVMMSCSNSSSLHHLHFLSH